MVSFLLTILLHLNFNKGQTVIKTLIITILSFSCLSWSLNVNMENALRIAQEQGAKKGSTTSYNNKISYYPLFNHSEKSPLKSYFSPTKEIEKKELIKKLIDFLTNSQMGSMTHYEYVSQTENDALLKEMVKAQLKQKDLIELFEEYEQTALPKIKERLLSDTASQQAIIDQSFEDGKRVLNAFIDVQNRIEKIENNLWNLKELTEELRKAYSGKNFKCYYSLYTKTDLERYKTKTIQEHDKFIKEQESFLREMDQENINKNSDRALINDFKTRFLDKTKQELEIVDSNDITDKEVKSLLEGSWSQRIIVARCFVNSVVKDYKDQLLKHYLPEQPTSLAPKEIDSFLNLKSINPGN